jgi:hypothetical protein
MTDSAAAPSEDTLSDQLVEATDRFTTELAQFDELPAHEVAGRLARVAFDYLLERNARLQGEDTDLADCLSVDEQLEEEFSVELHDMYVNCIEDHHASLRKQGLA